MYRYILGGRKELIRFLVTLAFFRGQHPIKTVKLSLFGTLSSEPVGGLNQNCIDKFLGGWKE